MPDFTQQQRQNLADKDQAMPDGSYPIRNTADLKRAIQAYGRASDKPATKRWIIKRARELDAMDMLPESWKQPVAVHGDGYSDELYHYDVKGMKWGIRKDKSAGRKLTRQVAAAKRNVRDVASDSDIDERAYRAAKKNYAAEASRFAINRKKKRERVHEAEDELNRATARAEVGRANLKRATDIYRDAEKRLANHLNEMVEKYGSNNVKQITSNSRKVYNIGQNWTIDMIKTGITIADLPIIGTAYTGDFISRIENERREQILNDRAMERADSRYV